LPISIAALTATHKTTLIERWGKFWKLSSRYLKMSKIDNKLPGRHIFNTLASLSHRASSILVQLCTGHITLKVFLHKIRATDSTLCTKCKAPETV
ncbi:hypothetical protein BU17DRAFT_31426, partial [Hysterangium stoloniferum]